MINFNDNILINFIKFYKKCTRSPNNHPFEVKNSEDSKIQNKTWSDKSKQSSPIIQEKDRNTIIKNYNRNISWNYQFNCSNS